MKQFSSEINYHEFNEIQKQLENLSKKGQKFCDEWQIRDVNFEKTFKLIREANKEIETLFCKLRNSERKCVIFGKTSSGKSSFANCLLQQRLLPTGNGSVTNCLIEIRKSTEASYLNYRNEIKDINELKEINNTCGIKDAIEIYVNSDKLPNNLIIYDTPATDFDEEVDEEVVKHCRESDIIILMVPARSAIGLQERRFVQSHKTKFTKFNVVIVYNFWDEICDEEDADRAKENNKHLAERFLIEDLNISAEEAKHRVYFISTRKIMRCLENDRENQQWLLDYQSLRQLIINQSNESLLSKRKLYLSECENIISKSFDQMRWNLEELTRKRLAIARRLELTLDLIEDFNLEINKIVEENSKKLFEEFLLETLKLVRERKKQEPGGFISKLHSLFKFGSNQRKKRESNENYENYSMISINEDNTLNDDEEVLVIPLNIQQELEELLESYCYRLIQTTKDEINNLIETKLSYQTDQDNFIQIMNEIYYPLYFDLSREIQNWDFEILYHQFLEIMKVQMHGTYGTAAAVAFPVAVGAAAAAVVVVPFTLAAEGAALVSVGAAAGTTSTLVAGGSTFGISKFVNSRFRWFWREHEHQIRDMWLPFEQALSDSYRKFRSGLCTDVNHIIFPLMEEYIEIRSKFLSSGA